MRVRFVSILPWGLAAAALVSLACQTPKQLPAASPLSVSPLSMAPGEWREVDNVVVITDASGTMLENETFPQAKSLSQSFVAALPDPSEPARDPGNYNGGTIGFGGDERVATSVAPFNRSQMRGTVDRVQIMGDLDGWGGETPLHNVLRETQHQLAGKSGLSAVVIFSDGLTKEGTNDALAVSAAQLLVASRGGQVCIHTVQTGDDEGGAELLQMISSTSSCGTYRTADSINDPTSFREFTRTVMAGAAPAAPVVASDACSATIRLRGIEFGFDRADINPAGAIVLDAAAEQLRPCPNIRVQINGYTDSVGTESYNQGLSERRANAVRTYLAGKGISASRLTTRGYGESNPIASNETEEGRAQNRRVELIPL